MSDTNDKYNQLTTEQALELGRAAEWYCGHEVTAEGCNEQCAYNRNNLCYIGSHNIYQ